MGEWKDEVLVCYPIANSDTMSVHNFPWICHSVTTGKVPQGVISGLKGMHILTFTRFCQIFSKGYVPVYTYMSTIQLTLSHHSTSSTSSVTLDIVHFLFFHQSDKHEMVLLWESFVCSWTIFILSSLNYLFICLLVFYWITCIFLFIFMYIAYQIDVL